VRERWEKQERNVVHGVGASSASTKIEYVRYTLAKRIFPLRGYFTCGGIGKEWTVG